MAKRRRARKATDPKRLEQGRKLYLRLLLSRGLEKEAKEFAFKVGLALPDGLQGGRGFERGEAGSINSSTSAEIKKNFEWPDNLAVGDIVEVPIPGKDGAVHPTNITVQNLSIPGLIVGTMPRGPLDEAAGGAVKRISEEGGAITAATLFGGPNGPETAREAEERREWERTHPEEFRPAREALPKEARWARVTGGAVNPLLRRIRFDDNGLEDRLWITRRESARGYAVVGRAVAVTWNEDERLGGWRLWRR